MRLTYDIAGTPQIHLDVLKVLCGETKGNSMVDLMCCEASQTRNLRGWAREVYVDIQKRDLGEKNRFFEQSEVLQFVQSNKMYHFDVAICLDGIEHLHKDEGYILLEELSKKADKQIIFTPLGDYVVEPESINPDGHRSGWMPEDFENIGYDTIVFPNFHAIENFGAFFAYKSNCIHLFPPVLEWNLIMERLKKLPWTK